MAKKITINDLAVMVQKGFVGVDNKIDNLEKKMNDRFDKIENVLLKQHSEKIERLEKRMSVLEEALVIKN